MAQVWRGVHDASGVPVAVKIISGRRARQGKYRELFRNEVRAMASLEHPAILRVFDQGDISEQAETMTRGHLAAGSPALAMELAEDGTLDAQIDQIAGAGWTRVRQVLLELLSALGHAHARGVIHRDLKPTNVLCFPDGRHKLADFGLAYALDVETRETGQGSACGTPHYMAPEQVTGEFRDFGPWTDLYAFGCLAYELVSGRPPFPYKGVVAVARAHLLEAAVAPKARLDVPDGFDEWLLRLLHKDPVHRFRLAADASHALLELGDADRQAPVDFVPHVPENAPTLISTTGSNLTDEFAPLSRTTNDEAEEPPPLQAAPFPLNWESAANSLASPLSGAGLGLFGLRAVPLVGRRAERQAMWDALRQASAISKTQLLALTGAGGRGKSRLARWLCERCHELGAATELRVPHGPVAGPASGLPRMLDRFVRGQGLDYEEVRARCENWAAQHGASRELDVDRLTAIIRPNDPKAGPGLSPAERYEVMALWLATLARERAVVLWLDDAQWGSDALGFAEYLATLDLPLLVLLTVRDEVLAERDAERHQLKALLARPNASTIEIQPLADADRRSLLCELLRLEPTLADQVESRSDGNPLFMIELVGSWVQRDLLVEGPEGFTLRSTADASIPGELHAVWTERIDRALSSHGDEARRALELAAALGITVDDDDWAALCSAGKVDLADDLLDALVEHALADRGDAEWSFRHPMLRESLERTAREANRWAPHHRLCAAMLQPGRDAGERGVAERIGEHLLEAGEFGQAVEPLFAGARERRESSDYRRARTLLGERERALLGTSGDSLEVARGRILRARIALHEGELAEVDREAALADTVASERDALVERTEALRLLGDAARRRGRLGRAAEHYEAAIAMEARVDDPHGIAGSLWGLGDALRQKGDIEAACDCFERSRIYYEQIGDAHGVADHFIGLADIARQASRFGEAREAYGHARSLFDGLSNRYGVARATNGLGECARLSGQLPLSVPLYRAATRTLEGIGSDDAVFPRCNLALSHLASGEPYVARELLTAALEDVQRRDWTGVAAILHGALGACAAELHETKVGDRHLEIAAALADDDLVEVDLAWCCERAADRAAEAGRPSSARLPYQMALAQWRALAQPLAARRVATALARL
jgi:serine/threonine protein kinase/tetratricopeptide (TPR) repeat protein